MGSQEAVWKVLGARALGLKPGSATSKLGPSESVSLSIKYSITN